MADTPSDTGTPTPPKRSPRKPRTTAVGARGGAQAAKAPDAKRGRKTGQAKPAATSAPRTTGRAKPATAVKRATASARQSVAAITPGTSTGKRFAIAAAVVGLFASIAAAFGRKRIGQIGSDVAEAIKPGSGGPSDPAPRVGD